MEHPDLTKINQYGYLEKEPEPIGTDYFGNDYYEDDRLITIEDMTIAIEQAECHQLINFLVNHFG